MRGAAGGTIEEQRALDRTKQNAGLRCGCVRVTGPREDPLEHARPSREGACGSKAQRLAQSGGLDCGGCDWAPVARVGLKRGDHAVDRPLRSDHDVVGCLERAQQRGFDLLARRLYCGARELLLASGEVVVQRAVRRARGIEGVAHARGRISLAAEQLPRGGNKGGAMAIGTRHMKMIVEHML